MVPIRILNTTCIRQFLRQRRHLSNFADSYRLQEKSRMEVYDATVPDVALMSSASSSVCVAGSSGSSTSASAPAYVMQFSENNPNMTWKDRTSESGDLKEVFSRFTEDGPVDTEILTRTRFLCAKYLGGAWSRIRLDQFKLSAITGGMSNLLFMVQLEPEVLSVGSEPRRALLRIHCQSNLDQLLTESVVFTMLSERALGPKLLGVFPGGRFEQFIPSRPLLCEEISLPRFSRLISPMISRIHTLDVPITKAPEIVSTMKSWLSKFRASTGGGFPVVMKCTEADVDPSLYPASLTIDDLDEELKFVEAFLDACDSPIVFSHNDLQEGNLLLCEGCEIADDSSVISAPGSTRPRDPLVMIDFEYCNYNYRGFDLANHFCEYGYDYNCDVAPYYKIHQKRFYNQEAQELFCKGYLEETYELRASGENPHFPSDLVTGNHEKDLAHLLQEAELFMPISNFFWTCWALINAEESVIQFDYGAYGRDRLALYFRDRPKLQNFLNRNSQ